MKKVLFTLSFLIFLSVTAFAQVDQIVGKWKTIDDEDGTAKSIVYIFKATNGKYYGKVNLQMSGYFNFKIGLID